MESKLSQYRKYAIISRAIILIALLYLLMVLIKGVWIFTFEPENKLSIAFHEWTFSAISNTYFFPLNFLWDYIPNIGISEINIKTIYIVFIPPMAICVIASLFISNYKGMKAYELRLDRKVAEKARLRKKEQEAGLYENQPSETININIEMDEPKITPWHNKWWGKIILPLLVMLIATAIGLRTI